VFLESNYHFPRKKTAGSNRGLDATYTEQPSGGAEGLQPPLFASVRGRLGQKPR